jgi:hypothetical protein
MRCSRATIAAASSAPFTILAASHAASAGATSGSTSP